MIAFCLILFAYSQKKEVQLGMAEDEGFERLQAKYEKTGNKNILKWMWKIAKKKLNKK